MPDQIFELISQSGIRRDGTDLDSPFYNDGLWVRFQRGKPRKMGGYRAMSTLANGPIRSMMVDSRNGNNSVHAFSQWGIQRLAFSASGSGGNLDDRTPLANFTPNPKYTWSHAVMTSSTGGSYSALLAAATPDLDQIDSDTPGFAYSGDMAGSDPLTVISDANGPIPISGGLTVLQPFLFLYGSNGLLKNSMENDFSVAGWAGVNANEANVAGTKFVYGAPVRGGGQSPAGLFWALDALVRVSFTGDASLIWRYDTLSSPTSLLSKKGIVEHDGKFFWPGTDRFMFYNGVVQELPNQMNSNWFFENLNMAKRNKVWGTKIPRWGEIWWFYPRGESDECDHAVIFNYNENTWYDAKKERSAGSQVGIYPFPIWGGREDSQNTTVLTVGLVKSNTLLAASGTAVLTYASTTGVVDGWAASGPGIPPGTTVLSHTGTTVTLSANLTANVPIATPVIFSSMTTPFVKGNTVVGLTTGATGTVARASLLALNVINIAGAFNSSEGLSGTGGKTATSLAAPFAQIVETIYQQETGVDKIVGDQVTALESSFTSKDFGFAIGTPVAPAPQGYNVTTRIIRVEPDFDQKGDLTMTTIGRSFAKDDLEEVQSTTITEESKFEDIRDAQARLLRVKVTSNVEGGFFDQGKVMLTLAPGDQRSGENI